LSIPSAIALRHVLPVQTSSTENGMLTSCESVQTGSLSQH
jgi:hypothetical protein